MPFDLDITPPSGSIRVLRDSPPYSFEILLTAGGAPISSWRLGVVHPDGRRFFDFISEDHRDNVVTWNGRALNNASLEPGITYALVAQVFDRYGNVGLVIGSLEVAGLKPLPEVTEEDEEAPVSIRINGTLVAETTIFFPAFSADLTKVKPWKADMNRQAFELLAAALSSVTGTKIQVIGHANQVFWQDKDKGNLEQSDVLLPLSLARATTVRDALVLLGLEPLRFEVSGVGALDPEVPFGDLVNNWKNRRVEFVVEP